MYQRDDLNSNLGKYSMNVFAKAIVIFVSCMSAAAAMCQNEQGTPTEQYESILKEYVPVSGGMRTATTDLERKECVERLATFSSKFLELADKYPNDLVALMALQQAVQADGSTDSAALNAWEMNHGDFPAGSPIGSASQIVKLIMRDHLLSERLAPLIDRMRYGYRMEYGQCLGSLLENNPHRDVQALACLSLARFLDARLQMLKLIKDRPELAECCEIVFGDEYLPALKRLGRTDLPSQIESLFERAVNEFSDVKFQSSTVGDLAKSELYDIRKLSVGMVAPEIEGQDQDGTLFKLSDFRGKVVLIYFWSEY